MNDQRLTPDDFHTTSHWCQMSIEARKYMENARHNLQIGCVLRPTLGARCPLLGQLLGLVDVHVTVTRRNINLDRLWLEGVSSSEGFYFYTGKP